jgi:MFS family permease
MMAEQRDARAKWAISTVFFINGAALGGYVAHLPEIQERLRLDNGQLGASILFTAIGAVTTMPFAGLLIQRFGSRRMVAAAGALLLLFMPLLSLAHDRVTLCAALLMIGVANGQMDVSMNAHSMAVQDRFDRPIISGVHGWFSLGGFAGGAGTALAAKLHQPMLAHLLCASFLMTLLLLLACRAMLPSSVDKHAEAVGYALPSRQVLFLGLLVVFAFVSEGVLWDWSAVYLRSKGAPEAVGAFGFALASFGMALGRLVGDGWTHRWGPLRVLLVGSAASALGICAAVSLGQIPLAIAGLALAGLGLANTVPLLFKAAARLPGISAGAGLAAVTTCGYTGFLAGPPAVGFLADRTSLSVAIGCAGLLCLGITLGSKRVAAGLERP